MRKKSKKTTGELKTETDDYNIFTDMQNRHPVRVEIPKFACGVRSAT